MITYLPYHPDYGYSHNFRYGAGGDNDYDIDSGDLWVGLLEKAYAQANEIGVFDRGSYATDGVNAYDQVEGGFHDATSHISGQTMHTWADGNYDFTMGFDDNTGTNISSWYGSDWLNLGDVLAAALAGESALWIGCWNNDYDANGYQTAVAQHAFAIIDYGYDSYGDLYFTLLNPWGEGVSWSTPSYQHTYDYYWADIWNYWDSIWVSALE